MGELTKKTSIYCGDCDEFREDADKKPRGPCAASDLVVYASSNNVSGCPKTIGRVLDLKVKLRIEVEAVKDRMENETIERGVSGAFQCLVTGPAGVERAIGQLAIGVGDQLKIMARELEPETKFLKEPDQLCPECGGYLDEETGTICQECGAGGEDG